MNEIKDKFIGTWKLVYSIEIGAAGQKYYPFGDNAIGCLMYGASGTMAVQICRTNRNPFISEDFLTAGANELSLLPKDYLAYFGRYELDLQNNVVSHIVAGHLCPNTVEKNLARKYNFFDNKLSLKPWDGTNREILWEKVTF